MKIIKTLGRTIFHFLTFIAVSIPFLILAFLDKRNLNQAVGSGLLKMVAYEVNLVIYILAFLALFLVLGLFWHKYFLNDLKDCYDIHPVLTVIYFILYIIMLLIIKLMEAFTLGLFRTIVNIPVFLQVIIVILPFIIPILLLVIDKVKISEPM